MIGLAVVLAGLGDAVALLHVALGVDHEGRRGDCGGKGGGDGDTGGSHAKLHGTISILVGLLYAVSLPMFPRGASWRSGLLTPLLWSGLVASTLGLINPTLNERINWTWFIGSQIAFGLAASQVIARTAKIATMQSLPLAQRLELEGQDGPEEKSGL